MEKDFDYKKEYEKAISIMYKYSQFILWFGCLLLFVNIIKYNGIWGIILSAVIILVSILIFNKSRKKNNETKNTSSVQKMSNM